MKNSPTPKKIQQLNVIQINQKNNSIIEDNSNN